MSEADYGIKAPVSWLPAGLISWYAPGDLPVALVTSWVALIGGDGPCLRTAWHGRDNPLARTWAGGDFVFNVPSAAGLMTIRALMARGKLCLEVDSELQQDSTRGTTVAAPRLTGCAVQIECSGGVLKKSGYDVELKGEVVLLHRGGQAIVARDVADLCERQPLSPLSSG